MTKLAIIVALILAALGVTTYKVYDGLVARPRREAAANVKPQESAPKASLVQSAAREIEADPEVVVEEFSFFEDMRRFGYRGPARCRTTSGVYVAGELSRHGIVDEIRAPDLSQPYAVIRCRLGKKTVYVLAQEVRRVAQDQPADVSSDSESRLNL